MNRIVAIVGRPNVGKSTLFNRVLGERRSVVHETAGVTRDRIAEVTDWAGHPFQLLDTGGIIPFGETTGDFEKAKDLLRKWGSKIAEKKATRATSSGVIIRLFD